MQKHPYLSFTLNHTLYGLDALVVEEIFSLPELTPIPEAPRDIVGIVNVRGEILPVMDMNLRFGYQSPDYHLSDSVVVLRWEDSRVGLIVNNVHEVKHFHPDQITNDLSHGRALAGSIRRKFVTGIARSEEDLLVLLDAANLIRYVENQDLPDSEDEEDFLQPEAGLVEQRVFCPNATEEERQVFRERAENLRASIEEEEKKGFKPLSVMVLDDEFFGIDLKVVREFARINNVTPVPCSPPHIIGNMNLRGEILTLVDLCGLFNLPQVQWDNESYAIVVEVEEIVVGVAVASVYDVMFLDPNEITTVPTAIHAIDDEYLQGAAPYHNKMMSILDLRKILLSSGLVVDQAV
ncbi:CheW protein [Halothece sp. PCC 7418]|uniref:chemotaxis protein CheW n=1 Tax=Halothece sp. (strain PCC 7418) TaxID=65093 RepID=UPI0002A0841A|nr:chemotaxis protein CheW [Halothece sp. PCC 7418]AFZ43213.1 CheW protein [Halothece sp. PCC 7418]